MLVIERIGFRLKGSWNLRRSLWELEHYHMKDSIAFMRLQINEVLIFWC